MKRKKMGEMSNKELLEYLLEKEIGRLRKIMFPHQRRSLLYNKINIYEGDLSSKNASGLWEREDVRNKFKYTHRITIHNELVNNYQNYKYNKWDALAGITKKWYKNRLIKTIRHELIHGITDEEFNWCDLEHCNSDVSPIFLSVLHWLGGSTNHNFAIQFKDAEIWQDIKDLKSYKEVDMYLTRLIMKYEKEIKKLKLIENKKDKVKKITENCFDFGGNNVGLLAYSSLINRIRSKDVVVRGERNHFYIGYKIMPKQLHNLVHKKLNNKAFENINDRKTYLLDSGVPHTVKLKKIEVIRDVL